MKKYLIIISIFLVVCGCSSPTETNYKQEQLQDTKQVTSTLLTKIPSKFAGVIACDNCDSIAMELELKITDQQFMLTLKYMGVGKDKRDSLNYENGKWEIVGANELHLLGEPVNEQFTRFKIISEDHIMLLDSTGSEKTNGKNYTLELVVNSDSEN